MCLSSQNQNSRAFDTTGFDEGMKKYRSADSVMIVEDKVNLSIWESLCTSKEGGKLYFELPELMKLWETKKSVNVFSMSITQ